MHHQEVHAPNLKIFGKQQIASILLINYSIQRLKSGFGVVNM